MSGLRESPCSIHRQCGACDLIRESESDQLEGKVQLIEQKLRRSISSAYASPLSLNYRARVHLRVTENGRLSEAMRSFSGNP